MRLAETTTAGARWDDVAPVVDDAVASLRERDRVAIVLRFFEGRSLADVAGALGISPEAAKQRVYRSLERLRDRLARRGVVAPTTSLGVLLAERASAVTAPTGLTTAAVAAGATKGLGGAGAAAPGVSVSSSIAKGAVKAMAYAKLKVAASLIAAAAVIGGGSAAVVAPRLAGAGPGTPEAPSPQAAAPVVPVVDKQVSTPLPKGAPARDEPWRRAFEAAYRLEDGEVLKRVLPPFVPERRDFINYRMHQGKMRPGEPVGERQLALEWDGDRLDSHWMSIKDGTVESALSWACYLRRWEWEASDRIRDLPMPGDWVWRRESSINARIAAFQSILEEAVGPDIQMSPARVQREVIVARGTPTPTPLPGARHPNEIAVFYGDRPPTDGDVGAFPTTTKVVLEQLEEMTTMHVVDEMKEVDVKVWLHLYAQATRFPISKAQRESLLANVGKQLGVDLVYDWRPLNIWEVTERKK
jgi:hypothetical protein